MGLLNMWRSGSLTLRLGIFFYFVSLFCTTGCDRFLKNLIIVYLVIFSYYPLDTCFYFFPN